ncbi:MAG: TlpA family protein disulfide reductase [Acidobacteria bacterium]|nr:MAG: TlpA family protein disulfide reductase [Acidobacteriota bacterium]PYY22641.1 MAG: TlpA family protein disulfide reductase [Acidobacteriota bacterium]
MQSRLRRVVAAYVIALLLIFAASAFAAKNVRKLTLRNLQGNKARLGDYQGRIVVLNFWATWCGPCKEELPRLGKMADQYAAQNVAFVLASIDEQRKLEAVRDFVAQQKLSLPVLVGADVDLLEQLSGTNVVPATLIIDDKGEIVRAINGEAHEEDVKQAVDWLLNGKNGPAPTERVKRY